LQIAQQERPVDIVALAPIALLVVAFYFLLIRPQKQRQRQQAEMVSALGPGAQIMTTAGMMGTVAAVADDEISLEISPGVFVRMVPAAVAKVIEPAPSLDAAPESDETP
jgi:preprotein translocase subunit YajC